MKCPICDIEMRISDREGVEIDYCPQCRGVWLDRGELEKIIAVVESQLSSRREHEGDKREIDAPVCGDSRRTRNEREDRYTRDEKYDDKEQAESGGKKREGFFSNLFDMFGD